MSARYSRRGKRQMFATDLSASAEAKAIDTLHALAPRRKDARVTSSIHFAPKKPGGQTGWLRMTQARELSSAPVRNASHRTPKLVNSYVRCFPIAT